MPQFSNFYQLTWCNWYGPPQGGLEITLSHRFFGQITPRNCLKFMFTPSLPNHAGCQIDFWRNHAIIFLKFPFSRSEIWKLSRFPLGGPLYLHHTLITWHNMFISLGSSYNQQKAEPVAVIFRGWKRKRNFAVLSKKSKKAARFVLNC